MHIICEKFAIKKMSLLHHKKINAQKHALFILQSMYKVLGLSRNIIVNRDDLFIVD